MQDTRVRSRLLMLTKSLRQATSRRGRDEANEQGLHCEVVWSDGKTTDRRIVPTIEFAPFGHDEFRIPFGSGDSRWVRFAVWDSAGDGAFTQPIHLEVTPQREPSYCDSRNHLASELHSYGVLAKHSGNGIQHQAHNVSTDEQEDRKPTLPTKRCNFETSGSL